MNDQRATLPAFSGLGASAGTQSLLGSRDAVGDLTDGGQIINSGREFARLTTSHVRSTRRSGTDSDAKSSQEDCFGVASTVSETDSHNRPHHSRNRSDLSTSVSPTATTSSCTQEVGDRSGHDGEVVDSNATLSPLSRRRGLGVRSNWSLRVRGSQAAGLITRRDVKSPQEATDPVKSAGQSWQISESQTTAEAAQAVVTRNPNGTGNCVGRTSAEVSCQDIHSLPTGPEDDAFFDMILRLQTATRIEDQRSYLPDPLSVSLNRTSRLCQATLVPSTSLQTASGPLVPTRPPSAHPSHFCNEVETVTSDRLVPAARSSDCCRLTTSLNYDATDGLLSIPRTAIHTTSSSRDSASTTLTSGLSSVPQPNPGFAPRQLATDPPSAAVILRSHVTSGQAPSQFRPVRASRPQSASQCGGRESSTTRLQNCLPDDDFFALIQRLQSTRLEEQRCNPPRPQ